MKLSICLPSPSTQQIITLATGLLGCHAPIKPLSDSSVDYAITKIITECNDVRTRALESMGNPNNVIEGNDSENKTIESCVCAVAGCDYVKINGSNNTTIGSLLYFDEGEEGVLSKADFELITPDGRKIHSEVSGRIQNPGLLRANTCDFVSSHTDENLYPKPRITPSSNMQDCESIESLVRDALEALMNQK